MDLQKLTLIRFQALVLFTVLIQIKGYSQNSDRQPQILTPLDWSVMECGRTTYQPEEKCELKIVNTTNRSLQGYWISWYGQLSKEGFATVEAHETRSLDNVYANELWVIADANNNALGVYKILPGINEIIITKDQLEGSRPLPKRVMDRRLAGTSSGGKRIAEQESYDVLHYDLSLQIFPESRTIHGQNIITAQVLSDLDQFVFDLDSSLSILGVSQIKPDEAVKLEFETIAGKHWVSLSETAKQDDIIKINIEYGGEPRMATHAPYQGGFSWNRTEGCDHWIATSCQVDGADLWIPCKDYQWDEADSANLTFTVPTGLKAISNGVLVSTKINDETTTFEWKVKNPINNYNIALNIAPYTYIKDNYESTTGDKLDIGYWALSENEERAKEFYPQSKNHLRFLESNLGPYPFRNEKLGVVEVPFVAMEHQTIIAMGPKYSLKYPDYNATLFHEICHEWFGNMVTAIDWKDYWIQESLVGYMEALYEESEYGREAYEQIISSFSRGLLNQVPLSPDSVVSSREIYSGDSYKKGAFLLHSLRYLIGKKNILKVLRLMAYPNEDQERKIDGSQCRFTTTDEFFNIAQEVSSQDLTWFKDVYFRHAQLPELQVVRKPKGLEFRWVTKDNQPFPMPLEIAIDQKIITLEFENNSAEIELNTAEDYQIDPNGWLLFNKAE